jgi:hypothetical protein
MTAINPKLLEQLSAWMDGELPADEARFLQRRLQNDTALRDQWERWQIASACLHGQPVRRMDPGLPGRIAAAISEAANDAPARRPKIAWLATAAALVLGVALLPQMLAVDPASTLPADAASAVASVPARPPVSPTPDLAVNPVPAMSPLPSVRDFPLVDNGGKAWPRSPLLVGPRDRDGLLVRNDLPWLAPVDDGRPSAPPEDASERESGNE